MKLFSSVLLLPAPHQVNIYSPCRPQTKYFFKEASLFTPNLDLVLLWHFLHVFPFEGYNRWKSDIFCDQCPPLPLNVNSMDCCPLSHYSTVFICSLTRCPIICMEVKVGEAAATVNPGPRKMFDTVCNECSFDLCKSHSSRQDLTPHGCLFQFQIVLSFRKLSLC